MGPPIQSMLSPPVHVPPPSPRASVPMSKSASARSLFSAGSGQPIENHAREKKLLENILWDACKMYDYWQSQKLALESTASQPGQTTAEGQPSPAPGEPCRSSSDYHQSISDLIEARQ